MGQSEDSSSHPALTRSDGWLLAALTEGPRQGLAIDLAEFVYYADWLNRLIPSYDDISFGLPRLVAAGFVIVGSDAEDGLVLRATPKAIELRRTVKAKSLGDVMSGMERAVGARPYPVPEAEDRSLGRLPGFAPEDLEAACTQNREELGQSVADTAALQVLIERHIQGVSVDDLRAGEFREAMLALSVLWEREIGYRASRFRQLLASRGGVGAARHLLAKPGVSTGFTRLAEAGQLDLTMEYLILGSEFGTLFTAEERGIARRRLVEHGMRRDELPLEPY
jgi:hypothetical protein